ncbi:thiopeptide-type bacteriocin biosynthesis protein [Parafrankia elaeagni]|uniref:thiopeptide-type bacteriocin biosynthesis protein n=1 Tax=Parafrankia elaeagni TaxID=222534 RepID=UPI000366F7F9|nr:thiopeptide-type bacteriocin biosynthesis protein [Parafrankia elaeagni]
MPAHHLTATAPHDLVAGVLTVLAGADLHATATSSALDPADLDDAVQVYQAAGLAALEQRADQDCYQVRVEFSDWSTAEATAATQLGPRLDQLQAGGAVGGWWFLRKHPCWRLRLHRADTAAVDHVLDELTAAGALVRWWPTVYEPETFAFGGPAGMRTVHELFCADSCGVLDYLRHDAPGLGRRELSILLLSGLMQAAGLDTFERGDVFARAAVLRPAPGTADHPKIAQLAANVRLLLSIPDLPTSELFAPGGSVAHAAPWLAAFHTAGRQLGDAAAQTQLGRGLRAILTHVLIFHWNRLGLSATSQAVLARAAATALLPRD